ncbi:hypothetical protein Thermus77359_10640 [Thermus oshimai]
MGPGQVEAAEDLPQAALHPVPHHRLAHLLGHHDAHPELRGGKPADGDVPPPPGPPLAEAPEGAVPLKAL